MQNEQPGHRLTAAALLFLSALISGAAHSATIVVDTLDDVVAADGQCSLREAVQASNQDTDFSDCTGMGNYGADRIQFDVTGTIALSDQIVITDNITVTGDGDIVLDGQNATRIIVVDADSIAVALSGLELRDGFEPGLGGCVYAFGRSISLAVARSTFRNCVAAGGPSNPSGFGYGGAIAIGEAPTASSQPNVVEIASTAFIDNVAQSTSPDEQARGGAIYAGSDPVRIFIFNSRFRSNFADASPGEAALGGALYGVDIPELRIDRTEFSDNFTYAADAQSVAAGGAVYIESLAGTGSIVNTTISGNFSVQEGSAGEARAGALFANLGGPTDSLEFVNATIVRNRSLFVPGATAIGGGLELTLNGDARITNTILANNTVEPFNPALDPTPPVPSDCLITGSMTSIGHNIIETNCGIAPSTGDQIGVDPLLEDLADNGGGVQGMLSHLPSQSSPAIDRGNPGPVQPSADPAACPDEDQRGVTRPFDAGGGPFCDIGAVETERQSIRPVFSIPTLSSWGLLLLAGLMIAVVMSNSGGFGRSAR